MRLYDIQCSQRSGAAALRARVQPYASKTPLEVFYDIEGVEEPLAGGVDALAVALLTPSMFEREILLIEGKVSLKLVRNMSRAQKILSQWYNYLDPVPLVAEKDDTPDQTSASGVACCFSAGVDSWYSLLKHQERVTHLLLVRGFDIGLDNDVLWWAARDRAAGVAAQMGIRLVTCETNIRDVADKRRGRWGRTFNGDFWGECLHGAALASVALLLRDSVGEVIIPATHTRSQIKPWGSSPLLDHFWSNGHVRILHDGCEANRIEKVRAVAQSDVALETLRVCYHDTSEINCGHCEKCLRTMLALRACGVLKRARTFPQNGSLSDVHGLIVPPHLRHHYVVLREEAKRVGDANLLKTVEIVMGERLSVRRLFSLAKRAVKRTRFGRWLQAVRCRLRSSETFHASGFDSRPGKA